MTTRRALLGLFAMIAALMILGSTACSSKSSNGSTATSTSARSGDRKFGSGGSDTDSPAAQFTKGWPSGTGGPCQGHTPGVDKILMTFCGGKAKLDVKIEGVSHSMQGGVCWFNGTALEIDFGVATGPGFTGTAPDYVTFQVPSSPGKYPLGTAAYFTFGGESAVVTAGSVEVAPELPLGVPITPEVLASKPFTGTLGLGIEGYVLTGPTGQRGGKALDATFSC